MPYALKGSDFIAEHPELRAKDFMDAFSDKSISAIFTAVGGDDTIRILPYIDLDIIKNNPKIFMGYSDSTINHFMLYKAGVVSFYGPSVLCEFGEYVKMFDYTQRAVKGYALWQLGALQSFAERRMDGRLCALAGEQYKYTAHHEKRYAWL